MINGLKIIWNPLLLVDTDVRTFPASKHRSARIRKKLIKRFGSEFKKKPAMYIMGNTVYAHPSFKEKIQEMSRTGTIAHI